MEKVALVELSREDGVAGNRLCRTLVKTAPEPQGGNDLP